MSNAHASVSASASDRAYAVIRGLILAGELAPGAPLGEVALAQRCGVSRTPVREALRRLVSELLVVRSESQRTFVAQWSLDDVADAFELRAIAESLAARRAAQNMTPEIIENLQKYCDAIEDATVSEKPDVEAFLEANRGFHMLILDAAASPRLAAVLATLVEQPVVWRTAQTYSRDELRRSHREHCELLGAFARADGAWASDIMSAHIRRAYHAYADAHGSAVDTDAKKKVG